ncbi:hypothetical protein BURCENK562V_C4217 [Burkholderia cenocepacia K56-2Valvano]|nr:hypothetical protein BURCENK562V_C4217 [Burkholderia cenocepacia K56-2Valvano]
MTVSTRVRDGAGGAGIGAEWLMANNELYGRLSSTVCLNCIGL